MNDSETIKETKARFSKEFSVENLGLLVEFPALFVGWLELWRCQSRSSLL